MTDLMGSLDNDLDKFASGGNLEKAYILILPGTSPAGGMAAAAADAAAVGAGDIAGGNSEVSSLDDMGAGGAGTRIEFLFNPTQYTVEKSADWQRTPQPGGRPTSVPVFNGAGPRSMSVDIMLDASFSGSTTVQDQVDLLFGCCQPTLASLVLGPPTPPFVMFGWGTTLGFLAFMQSVRAEYSLFKPDGTPIRANCSLVMEEIPSGLPLQNPTSGGSARRVRTTVAGDTLQSLSYQEYGKPTLWRAIARANGIEDPTRVGPGTNLLIPPIAEATELAEDMEAQWSSSLIILVEGLPLDPLIQDLFTGATIDNSLHLPDMFELVFTDPSRQVVELGGFVTGVEVAITIDGGDELPIPLMVGEVTSLELDFESGANRTIVRGFDLSNRLMRGRKSRVFQDMMASEIVEAILAENGIELNDIDPTDDVYQYKMQAGETDWDFIQQLAMDNGYRAYMQEGVFFFSPIVPPVMGDIPGTLEMAAPTQLVLGQGLVRLRAVVRSTEQVEDVSVTGWNPLENAPVLGVSPAEAIGTEILVQPEELSSIEGANTFLYLDYPTDDEDTAETKAAALGNQLAEAYAEIEGESFGSAELKAGVAVNLSEAGEPFDGAYTLTSTRHVFDHENGYITHFTCSGWQDRTMLGLAKGPEVAATPPPPKMPGVCSATVVNCRDPEDQGRVQVLFDFMGPEALSDWVRVAQIGASAGFGFLWIPEEGDEVLVAFEQGDPSHPVVIGSLYNFILEAAPGPETIDEVTGLVSERRISSRFQHNITFYDSEETSGILIATGDEVQGIFLNMEEGSLSIYNTDGALEIDAASIVINAEGDLTLSAEGEVSISGASVTIEGEGDVTMNGGSIEIAADGDMSIDAPIVAING